MKILSLANEIRNDVTTSGMKIRRATTTGYNIADRSAKIHKLGNFRRYLSISRSVGSKIIKETSRKEIPYVTGAIGMFVPFPFACPVLMGLGFLLVGLSNLAVRKSNHKLDVKA